MHITVTAELPDSGYEISVSPTTDQRPFFCSAATWGHVIRTTGWTYDTPARTKSLLPGPHISDD